MTLEKEGAAGMAPAGTRPATPTPEDNRRGIVAMLIAMGCFVVSDAMIKTVGRDLSLGQILLLRGLMACLMAVTLAVWFGWLGALWRTMSGPLKGRLALRTFAEIAASMCFLSGLLTLPFADNAAIGQLAPLVVTAGAALFLGESVGWRRWLATIAGFVGVLIIIKPGTSAFDWAALWTLASVGFIAMRDLMTARISSAVPTHHIATITTFGMAIGGAALMPFQPWRPVTVEHLAYLAGSAVGVLIAFYYVVVAMRSGEISVVGPFRYSVMVFSVLIGLFAFREVPTPSTIIGMLIVVGAGLYTLHREQVRKREQARARAGS